MPDIDDVAFRLYGADLARFTPERTKAAEGLTGEAAKAVRSLRKPTVAAWVVNQLVREAPEQVHALAELGEELQAAQAAGDGALLRELDAERRELTSMAVREAAKVAREQRQPTSGSVLEAVESTLRAVVLDPAAAIRVLEGCLDRALEASGFGSVASGPATPGRRGTARPAPTKAKKRTPTKGQKTAEKGPDPARVAEAERHLAQAQATLEESRAAADTADDAVDEAKARATDQEQQLTELRSALEQAEAALADTTGRLTTLREDAESADADHQAAELAVAAAERDRRSLDP